MIEYSDGSKKIFTQPKDKPAKINNSERKIEKLGALGLIAGSVGFILFSRLDGLIIPTIILGLAAVVFGTISLKKIKKKPEKYKGKVLALVSVLIGLSDILIYPLLYLLLSLAFRNAF